MRRLVPRDGSDAGVLHQQDAATIELGSFDADALSLTHTVQCANDRSNRMQAKTTDTPLAGMRLMIVDDDAQTRTMMNELMQVYGAETLWASNARDAARLLSEQAVHVVISDIGLPDLDGYELMRRLRQPGNLASATPAIALTGFAQANDERMALDAGYQGFVTKPIDVAALVALIRQLAQSQV